MLNVKVFQDICAIFDRPDIDLFASKHNYQLTRYASWTPDRNSYAIDAFVLNWGDFYAYCFCPFSVIPDVLKEIKDDAARVIVILPFWPTQAWFPKMTHMLINKPILLPRMRKLLTLPLDPTKTHPPSGETTDDGMSVFRERLGMSSISERSQRIILSGWLQGTKKQYNMYYKKWLDFTSRRDINPIDTTIALVLDFLSELVESHLSYSAINTARAALSACVTVENGMTLSENILVKKFMKGVIKTSITKT